MTFWDWSAAYPMAALVFLLYVGFIVIVVTTISAAGYAHGNSTENRSKEDG